jgi:hypothetical protein
MELYFPSGTAMVVFCSDQSVVRDAQVDFPLGDGDDPHGFACAGGEVSCYYKHKHLRAAFSNIPAAAKDGSSVSTKVGRCTGRCNQRVAVQATSMAGQRQRSWKSLMRRYCHPALDIHVASGSQVMIDSQGLMKVMHMITVHAAGDAMHRGPTPGTTQVIIILACLHHVLRA